MHCIEVSLSLLGDKGFWHCDLAGKKGIHTRKKTLLFVLEPQCLVNDLAWLTCKDKRKTTLIPDVLQDSLLQLSPEIFWTFGTASAAISNGRALKIPEISYLPFSLSPSPRVLSAIFAPGNSKETYFFPIAKQRVVRAGF